MMENNRSGRGNEHNPHGLNSDKLNGTTAPTGFEGMNFEQQRGSYRNNDIERQTTHKMVGRNNGKKRRGDL